MTKVFGQMPGFRDCALSTDSRALRLAQDFQANWLRTNFLPANDVQRVSGDMRYGTWSLLDAAREAATHSRQGTRSLGQTWVPEPMRNWMEGQAHRLMAESAAAETKLIADAWRHIEERSVRWPRWNTIAFQPVTLASSSLRNNGLYEMKKSEVSAAQREAFAKLFRQLSLDAPNEAARSLVEEAGERVDYCIYSAWLGLRYAIGDRGDVELNLTRRLRTHSAEMDAGNDSSLQLTAITTIAALITVSALNSRRLQLPTDSVMPLVSSLIDASESKNHDVAHAAAATLAVMALHVEDERIVVNAANVLVATLDRMVRHRKDIGESAHPMIAILIDRFKDVIPKLPHERYTYDARAIDGLMRGCTSTPNNNAVRSLRALLVKHELVSSALPAHAPTTSMPASRKPFARLM